MPLAMRYDNIPVNLTGPNMLDYEQTVRDYRFNIPEYFNYGFDVVDRWAADRTKLALVWADQSGTEIRKYSFFDLQQLSNRFANLLRAQGFCKGDRLFVMVYRDEDGLTYVKRFKFGGTILNREYRCIPPRAGIVLCWPEDVRVLYVRYTDGGGPAVDLKTVKTRGVKTLGRLLTTKPAASVHAEKPERWSDRRCGRPRPPLGS